MKREIEFQADSVNVSTAYDKGQVKVTATANITQLLRCLSVQEILANTDADEFLEVIGKDRAMEYWG